MARQVMPILRRQLPQCTLSLVGMAAGPNITSLQDPSFGIDFVGEVEDVRPYMRSADVFVIPLRFGGGTRLKALEAMAAGVPVVSTSLGVAGLGAAEAGVVRVADSPAGFADAVTELMGDESLRRRLSREARRFVEERYPWQAIAQRLEQVIAEVTR